MTARHTVIDSPLGELTLVADNDPSTGVCFRRHWRPAHSGCARAVRRASCRRTVAISLLCSVGSTRDGSGCDHPMRSPIPRRSPLPTMLRHRAYWAPATASSVTCPPAPSPLWLGIAKTCA